MYNFVTFIKFITKNILCELSRHKYTTIIKNADNFIVDGFKPNRFAKSPLMQSIIHKYYAPKISYDRHIIKFSDNCNCCLDFVYSKSSEPKGILFCVPGFSGTSDSPYCKYISKHFSEDYIIIIYNKRGHVKRSFSNIVPTHYDENDLNTVLEYIQFISKMNNSLPIYGVSFSGGSNVLTKYAGISGDKCIFKKIMACGNGWEYDHATQNVKEPFMEYVLCQFGEEILENVLNGMHYSGHSRFRDQEASIHHTNDLSSYYKRISAIYDVQNITVPCLCLDSIDDPLYAYPHIEELAEKNKNITFIYTSHGGHVCWVGQNSLYYIQLLKKLLNG